MKVAPVFTGFQRVILNNQINGSKASKVVLGCPNISRVILCDLGCCRAKSFGANGMGWDTHQIKWSSKSTFGANKNTRQQGSWSCFFPLRCPALPG